MSISSLSYLPASRGTLLALRNRLQLVKRGKEILEMRRDQLVGEVFRLIEKLRERGEVERRYVESLAKIAELRVHRGEQEFRSIIGLVRPPEIEILLISIQGVAVPQAKITEEPDFSLIKDPEYRKALEGLWASLKELIEMSNIEVAIERLVAQLSYINRVVNSLEKNIIPSLEDAIRYIGEKLDEEMLGEHIRIMKIREARGGH